MKKWTMPLHDECWPRQDRVGEVSASPEHIAGVIARVCGLGSVLDIGSGEGALVRALLARGMDARGIDVSSVVVDRVNRRIPGRISEASVLALPFPDASVDAVVSTDCLEHLAPEDVPAALGEIYRVARRHVVLQIATTEDRDGHWHLTVEGRAWWETRCFEAGFRKHPLYYRVNDYAALNQDGWQVFILLEKVPAEALVAYPLTALMEERNLHMDMLRDSGERSDAHVIRYQWASAYVKSGDRVLDAACGLGYGTHVVRNLTDAAEVVGIDGSDYAIDYATRSYAADDGRVRYRCGLLPQALASYEDGAFDVVISFETLEHVDDPVALLEEFRRVLAPGGRLIASVPNDWSDETGSDPNPHHLHVYTWERLQQEVSAGFIVEATAAQTATRCKIPGQRLEWERCGRSLTPVSPAEAPRTRAEWWLIVGMKSPLQPALPYRERAFANVAATGHPSVRYAEAYDNPWLMHSLVNVGYRLSEPDALDRLAAEVLATANPDSNDRAAALCVAAYQLLGRPLAEAAEVEATLTLVAEVIQREPRDAMGFRWRVSLQFVRARLLLMVGRLDDSLDAFIECAQNDVRRFGVHLATKTTEAWFLAGKLAYTLGRLEQAGTCWRSGVRCGEFLQSASLDDILMNRAYPNLFNHGDGVREYALAWDNIARCANGLHQLARGGRFDIEQLETSFQGEYAIVSRDAQGSREALLRLMPELSDTRALLVERTNMLEAHAEALKREIADLVATRQTLVERTDELVRTRSDLVERTESLVGTRRELVARTDELVATRRDLVERTDDLVGARAALTERTSMLEAALGEIASLKAELAGLRPSHGARS
ncbi:methyltransferase domain-containing protein [Azoarcus olearius]|uniref:Methyltransferase type 11 domain-containing protein n=1 Tax=Azoarcus sp. (strain BH72) TaxID=418699 RepID=A1KBK5_AZOSB|nr:methyltransferase domain-containing protein [Azoarcus olearius]CAL96211.1 Hypothetical protein predicted by Glimmer/Critica [Azoarcus olearius]